MISKGNEWSKVFFWIYKFWLFLW